MRKAPREGTQRPRPEPMAPEIKWDIVFSYSLRHVKASPQKTYENPYCRFVTSFSNGFSILFVGDQQDLGERLKRPRIQRRRRGPMTRTRIAPGVRVVAAFRAATTLTPTGQSLRTLRRILEPKIHSPGLAAPADTPGAAHGSSPRQPAWA